MHHDAVRIDSSCIVQSFVVVVVVVVVATAPVQSLVECE
jgi:hypothetical protein